MGGMMGGMGGGMPGGMPGMGMPAAPAAAPGMMPGGYPGMPGVLPGPPSVGSMGGDPLASPIPTPYLGVNGMITADVLDNTDEYKEVGGT
jgi:suppressor of tumorigenicity protein 13